MKIDNSSVRLLFHTSSRVPSLANLQYHSFLGLIFLLCPVLGALNSVRAFNVM